VANTLEEDVEVLGGELTSSVKEGIDKEKQEN
jgi:hypothetical protein